MTHEDTEVVILGLGVHGSAAAAALARRGVSVIALDRFNTGHRRGSSHGRTRMIRRAYPNPIWNQLVDDAYRGWRELEQETGQTLIHTTGGLYAHRGDAQLQGPDCRIVDDHSEMQRLMPGFAVPHDYQAVYDPHAGVLEAESGVAAMRDVALRDGAELRWGAQIRSWEAENGRVRVHTDEGEIRARRIVIAAGGFIGRLVPEIERLVEVWRILTLTVASGQAVAIPPSLGALSVDRPEGLVFGLPDAAGNGFKIGMDAGQLWDPETPAAPPTSAEVRELQRLMNDYVPGVDDDPVEAIACLYTMTRDKRFILGALRRAPEVVVASACSGHGFKFGPAIGEALADIATGVARDDLEFISTSRREL